MKLHTINSPRPAEEHARQRAQLHALAASIGRRLDAELARIDRCLAGRPTASTETGGRA